jgi:hypothetical protein
MKKILMSLAAILIFSTASYAESLSVVSIEKDFQWAVLKESPSEKLWHVKIGDTVAGWKVQGITPVSVSVSKLHKGYILITKLSVPDSEDYTRLNNIK